MLTGVAYGYALYLFCSQRINTRQSDHRLKTVDFCLINKGEIMVEKLIEKMAKDIDFMKQRLVAIEEDIKEISEDMHDVRPEYIEKLNKIDRNKFLTRAEFEKMLME